VKKPHRLEDCWDEPDLPEKQAQSDLELLQGAWVSLSGRREAQLLISGCRYTVWFKDGSIYMGRFELSPTGQLRTMEMSIDEGPSHHRGKSAPCIYELSGATLRWCTAGPGQTEPPEAFPETGHPQYLCIVFRREAR
jgi:uncharacterized protein (TIGR03067 family)